VVLPPQATTPSSMTAISNMARILAESFISSSSVKNFIDSVCVIKFTIDFGLCQGKTAKKTKTMLKKSCQAAQNPL
jgi:hypothetical protein